MRKELLAVVLVACGASAPDVSAPGVSAPTDDETARDEIARDETTSTASSSAAEPVATSAPQSIAPRQGAPVALGRGSSVRIVRVGADAVALASTFDAIDLDGYRSDRSIHLLEVLDVASLAPRWRMSLPQPITALAASPDGAWLAVGSYARTELRDARDGAVVRSLGEGSLALAVGDDSRMVSAGLEPGVRLQDGSTGEVSTLTLSGRAPTVIHAMMADGECQTIYDETDVRAVVLELTPDGWVAGASDGSVRVLERAGVRTLTRTEVRRRPGYASAAVALRVERDAIVAAFDDGALVRWAGRSTTGTTQVRAGCTEAELRRMQVRGGEPPSSDACGASSAVIEAGRVLLAGGGARVRARSGRTIGAWATLHAQAILVGDVAWLAGSAGTIERFRVDGTFVDVAPLPSVAGAVLDLSPDGAWVVVRSALPESPFADVNLARPTIAVRGTATGALHEAIAPREGWRARFVGAREIAIERGDHSVEVVDLASGVTRLRFAPESGADYQGLVYADATWIVLSAQDRLRRIDVATGNEVAFAVGGGVVESVSRGGDRVAATVFQSLDTGHRVEVWDLGGEPRRVHAEPTLMGAASLSADGCRLLVRLRSGLALVDLERGSREELAPLAAVGGFDAQGRVIGTEANGGPAIRWEGGARVALGAPMLSIERVAPYGAGFVIHELGGALHLFDARGARRASVWAVDDGFVTQQSDGAWDGSVEARGALRRIDGEHVEDVSRFASEWLAPGSLREAALAIR